MPGNVRHSCKNNQHYAHQLVMSQCNLHPASTIAGRFLLIGYLYGVTSERKLVDELRMHLAWRWFTGLGNNASERVCCPIMISMPPRLAIQQSMARTSSSFYHASATTPPANYSDFFNTHRRLH